jgi:Fe-S cluster assembly iron-binding protein IscA
MKRTRGITWIVFMIAIFESMCLAAASVVVSPASVQVKPGAQVQFSATGSADNVVLWSISGTGCSGIACGAISFDGLYTAPATAPNPSTVAVIATSLADFTQAGRASVTIGTPASVGVSISPTSVTIAKSGQQQFSANVTGTSNTAVTWIVSGVGCVSGSCGTITSGGLYTAPAVVPNPAQATVTATSVAAPTKSASATIVIESAASVIVSVSPPTAQVNAGGQQQFSAKVTGSTNTSVKWTVAGTGCAGSACGSISASGLYTAPATAPTSPTVTITATAVAAPSQSAKATVTITAATPKLTISPVSPQVKPGGQVQFLASGPGSGVVVWSISGSGCSGISCGSINSSGVYTAPATAPSPAILTVTATSLSNPSMSGSTTVTILSSTQVSVTISPTSIELNTQAQQQFKAAVSGNSNTAVTWSVTGFGCGGASCGTITSGGLYTAPTTPPAPSFVSVTATSVADPTKSSTATVTIIQQIAVSVSPASVQLAVGASQQFTAKVTGTAITGVSWSVTGSGCAGSTCGTITPTGVYTAPDTVPTSAKVSVTATSTADGTTSASATVTLIIPIQVTISPTNAIVTVGNQQQFRATVSGTKNTAVTWSVSGAGCSGTACGTITTAGLYTAPANVPSPANIAIKAAAQANPSSSASATVTITLTNNSKLNGQYAFLFTGFDSNGIYQAAGSFTADGHGKITSGLEDVNNSAAPVTDARIAGTYQVGADNRGVMTISSPLGTHTFRFSLNLLGTKGRFISFDNSGVRGSGVLELQDPAAFDASVISGGYVFNLTGMDSTNQRIGALGLIFPSGSGFISGSSLDVNDGGAVFPTFATFDGVYSVDDATGRGTATLSIPGFDGGIFNFAFYVVSANEFLMISTDPLSFDNPIFSGPAELQTGAPFTGASFTGGSVFSLSGTNGSAPQDTVGRLLFNGGQGVTMTFDQNSGGKVTVAGTLNGAYDLELNGRGTLNLANPDNGTTTVWYMYTIAPNEAFLMDASTGAVAVGEMKAQLADPSFSNSSILGTYLFGSGEPIVGTTPLLSGVANLDGSSSVQGQGIVTGTEDMSQSSALTTSLGLSGTYSVSSVSNNGRGAILLTSPSGKTIAVWVTSTSEFVGLNIDSTTLEPAVLHFEQ